MFKRLGLTVALLAAGALALATGQAISRTHVRAKSGPSLVDSSSTLEALRSEIAVLRSRMGNVEGRAVATRISWPGPAGPSATPPASTGRAGHLSDITAEQQSAFFGRYFEELDRVRTTHGDPEMVATFSRAIAAVRPEFSALGEARVGDVSCGSGLCRMEATWSGDTDASSVGSQLILQIGAVASEASVHIEPTQRRLIAYFAVEGRSLPRPTVQ